MSKNNKYDNYPPFGSKFLTVLVATAMVLVGMNAIDQSFGGIGPLVRSYGSSIAKEAVDWTGEVSEERRAKKGYYGRSSQGSRKLLDFNFSGSNRGDKLHVTKPRENLEKSDRQELKQLIGGL